MDKQCAKFVNIKLALAKDVPGKTLLLLGTLWFIARLDA